MTPDQMAFAKAVTRMMRVSGKLFLVFWLSTCAILAIAAVCALLEVPDRTTFSGSSTLWALVLLGSLAAAGVGPLFLRFWQRTFDRSIAQVQGAMEGEVRPEEPETAVDPQRRADEAGGGRMSTGTHIALQFGLGVIGGLTGLIGFVAYLRDATDSQLGSALLFAFVVGLSAAISRLIMFLVPARCPNCSGPTYSRGSRPIVFVCRRCGHRYDTGITFGSEDGHA